MGETKAGAWTDNAVVCLSCAELNNPNNNNSAGVLWGVQLYIGGEACGSMWG